MSMGTWKRKITEKKHKRSQTPGAKKADSCKTCAFKQFMAKRSRSYKHRSYAMWCAHPERLASF